MHHGHQKGIIHRDLKPANILVDGNGEPKVIDFGVARSTDSDLAVTTLQTDVGQLIGTLQYMSPEQCAADPHDLDTRSDIYSLGVVLFELLTDQLPYDVTRSPIHEAVQVVREATPIRPSTIDRTLRGDLETIALKALEKDREGRYASAVDLAQDLRRYLNHEPIQARPPSAMYQFRRFVRRNRPLALAAAVILVLLIGGIGATSWQAVLAKRAAADEAEQRKLAEAVYEFMHHTLTAFEAGEHDITLREVLDEAAATIEGQFPDQPLVAAEVRYMISSMYFQLGEYHLAEPYAREALDTVQRELGRDDPKTVEVTGNLARLLQHLGKFNEAETLYQHVLDSRLEHLGQKHALTLQAMNNLGMLLYHDHRLMEAEPLIRRSLEVRMQVYGEEHRETLVGLNNLALVLSAIGDFQQAGKLYEQVLEVSRGTLGDQDPMTIRRINNLAWHYLEDSGRPEDAEPLFREALKLGAVVYPEGHPELLAPKNGLGVALKNMRRFDEAEPVFRDLIEASRDRLGATHRDTLRYMNNLAVMLQQAHRLTEAEPLLREVLTVRREIDGDHHPSTVLSIWNLAYQCWWQGNVEEADELFEEATHGYAHLHGESGSETTAARLTYGRFLLEQGCTARAEAQFRKVCKVRREHLGADHGDTVASQVLLATALLELDRNDEAETILRSALAWRSEHLGDDHWLTHNTRSLLGGAMLGNGQFDQAKALLIKAYEALASDPDALPVRRDEALARIIELYDARHVAEPDAGHDTTAAMWRGKQDDAAVAGDE